MSDFSLRDLEQIIIDRRDNPPTVGSYTASLFKKGRGKISQKVGEEATEVIVAALSEGQDEQIGELADLFFHTLVLMAQMGITLEDVETKLKERHK